MLKFFFYNFAEEKETEEIIRSIHAMIEGTKQYERMEEIMLFVMVPPLSLEAVLKEFDRKYVKIAAQSFSVKESPPVTGGISLSRLKAIGTDLVTTGLADARHYGLEDNETVADKVGLGLTEGLKVLFCIGEEEEDKKEGRVAAVLEEQIRTGIRKIPLESFYRCALLYRPFWAFGSEGIRSDPDYSSQIFDLIRKTAEKERPEFPEPLPLIYGGILDAEEARDLLCREVVDGVLVDSSRMETEQFITFINSCYR
ncbi:MAG: triose-phosphate isomerase [Parasporobacterium sp.]|nr:triose-phosphate isomerase [Parasporobacterium sp.]